MIKYKLNKFYIVVIFLFAIISTSLLTYREVNLKEVSIIDEYNNYYIKTLKSSVKDILESCNIELDENDDMNYSINDKIENDMEIEIYRSYKIVIHDGNQKKVITTTKHNVRDVLIEENIEINNTDIVSPFIDAKISEGTNIDITRVFYETIKEEAIIPHNTEINLVKELDDSQVITIKDGIDGLMEVDYQLKFENGKIVSKEVVGEVIKIEPISEIKNQGLETLLVTSRGMPFRYSKVIICEATAYDLSYGSCGKYPGDTAYGITYTGTQARPGIIAVDPKVIPLRSKVYIESLDYTSDYGFAIAEDTGSAIKGNKVDLFISNHYDALRYGRRQVKVYIIEDDVEDEYIKGYGN